MVPSFVVPTAILAAACALAIPLAAGSGLDSGSRPEPLCPQGLTMTAGQCAAAGQARKFYRRGDRILEDYIWIGEPGQWAPDPYGSYLQAGGYVYQVNRETQKVLRLIGAAAVLPD